MHSDTDTPSIKVPSRAQGQDQDLVPRHGHCAQILVKYLEKRCVHISAQQESYLDTKLGHRDRQLWEWDCYPICLTTSPSLDFHWTGSLHCRLLLWPCLFFQGHRSRWKQNKELSPSRQAVLVYKKWYVWAPSLNIHPVQCISWIQP